MLCRGSGSRVALFEWPLRRAAGIASNREGHAVGHVCCCTMPRRDLVRVRLPVGLCLPLLACGASRAAPFEEPPAGDFGALATSEAVRPTGAGAAAPGLSGRCGSISAYPPQSGSSSGLGSSGGSGTDTSAGSGDAGTEAAALAPEKPPSCSLLIRGTPPASPWTQRASIGPEHRSRGRRRRHGDEADAQVTRASGGRRRFGRGFRRVALAFATSSRRAASQGADVGSPLALDWSAPVGCPTREHVIERVTAIVGRSTKSRGPLVRAIATPSPIGPWRVNLVTDGKSGARSREFEAESCDAAADATR